MMKTEYFAQWGILELMGHRKLAGLITERTIAGKGFIQIDIPDAEGKMQTQIYNPDSVYAFTPMDEQICRAFAQKHYEQPISQWELRQMLRLPEPSDTRPHATLFDYSDRGDDDDEY